jgi:hypothetical protein
MKAKIIFVKLNKNNFRPQNLEQTENFAVLTPKMAKGLSLRLDEASSQALADHLSE